MLQESIKNPHTADIIFSTDLIDNYSTMADLVEWNLKDFIYNSSGMSMIAQSVFYAHYL